MYYFSWQISYSVAKICREKYAKQLLLFLLFFIFFCIILQEHFIPKYLTFDILTLTSYPKVLLENFQ